MKRILSTSALTILMASGATAQETTQPAEIFVNVPSDPSMVLGTDYIGQDIYSTLTAANGTPAGEPADTGLASTQEPGTTETGEAGTVEQETAVAQQPQSVGQISDVIMTQDGQVEYVILGVGGFLGIGEQNVAVNFDALSMQPDPQNEGEVMIMISATKEQIENAPQFDRAVIEGTAESMETGTVDTEANTEVETTVVETTETEAEVETTQPSGEMETIEADSSTTVEIENSAEDAAAETEQAVEGAANETEQAVEGAANEAEQAVEGAGEAVGNAVGEAASETGQAVEEAGDAIENVTDEATSAN